jgi:hypothetical protein
MAWSNSEQIQANHKKEVEKTPNSSKWHGGSQPKKTRKESHYKQDQRQRLGRHGENDKGAGHTLKNVHTTNHQSPIAKKRWGKPQTLRNTSHLLIQA